MQPKIKTAILLDRKIFSKKRKIKGKVTQGFVIFALSFFIFILGHKSQVKTAQFISTDWIHIFHFCSFPIIYSVTQLQPVQTNIVLLKNRFYLSCISCAKFKLLWMSNKLSKPKTTSNSMQNRLSFTEISSLKHICKFLKHLNH